MRSILAVMLLAAALPVLAQSAARPRPPGTTPLEEPPPMPAESLKTDPSLEPVISTRRDGPNEVTEYRVRGKLYMVRITPPHGRPYVMMDHKGDGTFARQDNTLDERVRVPQWVLLEF